MHSATACYARGLLMVAGAYRRAPNFVRAGMVESLTYLGKSCGNPSSPLRSELDVIANPHDDTRYVVRFTAPEFTTLCPVTGQPDFAHFVFDYVPAKWLIE